MITIIITFLLIVNLFYTSSGRRIKKERPLTSENLTGTEKKISSLKEDSNNTKIS
jgi:hypothetical protein